MMKSCSERDCFDPRRKHAPVQLGRVLVLGLGLSGKALAQYLLASCAERLMSLTLAASAESDDSTEAFVASLPVPPSVDLRVQLGCDALEGSWDLCITSPGISPTTPLFQSAQASSVEMIGEVEFAWRESSVQSRWVAVTGTNGKTTTTALIAHILSSAGLRAEAVGNIGEACIEAVSRDAADIYVAETSSFQLTTTSLFSPEVGIILGISPDHLSWHGSFEAYRDAKLKLLDGLNRDAVAVLNATDPVVREVVRTLKALPEGERAFSYVPLGAAAGLEANMREVCGSEQAAYVCGQTLVLECAGTRYELLQERELQIKGRHNALNALASAAAALALGLEAEVVAAGLRTFTPLAHRIEPCGVINGVEFYNDSKATNVDAALAALAAFVPQRPIVLFGGCDKGTDLAPLVEAAREHCRAAVCFGAAGPRFAEAFECEPDLVVLRASRLEDALDCALELAKPGDIVVLSPACSSFDEFSCFEERGDVFKALVAQRSAGSKNKALTGAASSTSPASSPSVPSASPASPVAAASPKAESVG